VSLERRTSGTIDACFHGRSVSLGTFSAKTTERAQELREGLPIASFAAGSQNFDKELDLLVRRLARRGLLEYCLQDLQNNLSQVVIEPQVPEYWPTTPQLSATDVLVLSRFAYMRRRGNEMVLESPRASALFRICDPKIAATIALLSTPQQIKQLSGRDEFCGGELLALLVDCQILFGAASGTGLRSAEGDENLVLWDFHDLLFHTRSMEGRHANPSGGLYQSAHIMAALPAVRPPWPGTKIDLKAAHSEEISTTAQLLRRRHSTRSFDDQRPINATELSRFLDASARVLATWSGREFGNSGPTVAHTVRPYPSAGASYELELYLSIDKCEGLGRGFFHYDAGEHALARIEVATRELEALLVAAKSAMGASSVPQVLITIAARFGRMSWKYSSIAYALILKDVGALMQTFYMMATEMGLGACAIGTADIELFAKMTGIQFHIEGPVGQFAIGSSTNRAIPTQDLTRSSRTRSGE